MLQCWVRGKGRVEPLLWLIASVKLAVHLYANRHYGYFVDELYYLACSRHLDWGYVDQPPLIAVIAWIERHLLGETLAAIRLLPALAGTGEVVLTWLITRELGGGGYACVLASLAVLVAPGILGVDNFLSMNAFEPVIWMACTSLLLRLLKTGKEGLWIWFGILCGIGLENKYSMLLFGAGTAVGLLMTKDRRVFRRPGPWIAAGIAFLIFVPNLLWNLSHGFPFLELQANIRQSGRDVALNPVQFFGQEVLTMHPVSAPLWLAGLWFFLGTKRGGPFRWAGWAWVFTAGVIVAMSPRIYYLFPAFPLLFAGGAVEVESWFAGRAGWTRAVWPMLMVSSGILIAPMAIPVLPPETYIRYAKALGIEQPAIETHRLGPLPQLFADQFGWEEMAMKVTTAYQTLGEPVRSRTAIFGQNYGQAGAIDLFGPKYGLPPALSGHQSYFLWGPRGYTGESVIVMGDTEEALRRVFRRVEKVARVEHPYSMPYQHFDVYYCSEPRLSLQELWPRLKAWH